MAEILYANDVDLHAVYGFAPTNLDGWWDRPQIDRDQVALYGLMGVVPAPLARVKASQWPLEGILIAETPTERRDKKDALNAFLQGTVEWRLADADRVAYGEVVGDRMKISREGRWGDDGRGADAELQLFVAFYDVAKYDRLPTIVAEIGATPVVIAQGSASSFGIITITAVGGSAVNPELIGRDGDGVQIGNMPFNVTLPTGDSLILDMANHTVTLVTSGVPGDPADGLPLFDFENGWWFALPKGDPTLEVTTGEAEIEYRRRWL